MNNLVFAFETVFPLCFLIVLGYQVKRILHLESKTIQQMNQVCFYLFLSSSLFFNVYRADFTSLPYALVISAVVLVVMFFIVVWLLVQRTKLNREQKALMIQGIVRSNYILFGLPLTISFFGEENTSTTAIVIAFVIPLFNLLSIIILQVYQEKKIRFREIVSQTIKNPLIVAALAAFVCIAFSISLPPFVLMSLQPLASAATPLALFLLGASFVFIKEKQNIKLLSIVVFAKLVVLPAIMIVIALTLGFQAEAFLALFALSASPTAVSSYTMAQSMNMKDELSGQIVVFTTMFSMVSLFVWVSIIKQFIL